MIKSILNNPYLTLLIRIILGLVFIISSIEKIIDPESFAVSITNYRIFPIFAVNFVAIIVPWVELITGLFVLFGFVIKESSFIVNIMLIIFIILIASAFIRGLDIECGCFGTLDGQKVGLQKIIENVVLLILGLKLFYQKNHKLLLKGTVDENS